MGKIGRFACIFTPMALTIASLVCLAIVGSGQLNSKNSLQRDIWFFKADTQQFNADPGKNLDKANKYFDNPLLQALQGVASTDKLKDFYTVGLFNYCEGTVDNKTKVETVTYCSPRQNYFWFNPVEVWQLSNTSAQKLFPDTMQKGLDTYHSVSRWMFAAFMITAVLTFAEILIGISALFSRWGSLVTTIVSTAQTLFFVAAAVTATAVYSTLAGVFATVLKPYNIKASVGTRLLAVLWLGVAFSLASGFFWLISSCCCSGKSDHKKVTVEKTPYTYERVSSPYLGNSANHGGQQAHHMGPVSGGHGSSGGAYEPFRHGHV